MEQKLLLEEINRISSLMGIRSRSKNINEQRFSDDVGKILMRGAEEISGAAEKGVEARLEKGLEQLSKALDGSEELAKIQKMATDINFTPEIRMNQVEKFITQNPQIQKSIENLVNSELAKLGKTSTIWDNILQKNGSQNITSLSYIYQKILNLNSTEMMAKIRFRELCRDLGYPEGLVERFLETSSVKVENGSKVVTSSLFKAAEEVTPKPDEVKPDEVKPDEVKPDEVKPDEVTPTEGDQNLGGLTEEELEVLKKEAQEEVKKLFEDSKAVSGQKNKLQYAIASWIRFTTGIWGRWFKMWRIGYQRYKLEFENSTTAIQLKLKLKQPISVDEWRKWLMDAYALNRKYGDAPQVKTLVDKLFFNNYFVDDAIKQAIRANSSMMGAYEGLGTQLENSFWKPFFDKADASMDMLPILRFVWKFIRLGGLGPRIDRFGKEVKMPGFSDLIPNGQALVHYINLKDARSVSMMFKNLMQMGRDRAITSRIWSFVWMGHILVPAYVAFLRTVAVKIKLWKQDLEQVNLDELCDLMKQQKPESYNPEFCEEMKKSLVQNTDWNMFWQFMKEEQPIDWFNVKYEGLDGPMSVIMDYGFFWTYWDDVINGAWRTADWIVTSPTDTSQWDLLERVINDRNKQYLTEQTGWDWNMTYEQNMDRIKNEVKTKFTEADKQAIVANFYTKYPCYYINKCGKKMADESVGIKGIEVIDWTQMFWNMITSNGIKYRMEVKIKRVPGVDNFHELTSIEGYYFVYKQNGQDIESKPDCSPSCEDLKRMMGESY